MNRSRPSNLVLVAALLAIPHIGAAPALGERLIINSQPSEYALYVPVVLDILLELDPQQETGSDDPMVDREVLRKLRRRLYLELRDGEGRRLSRSFLTGVQFVPIPGDRTRFRAVALGFLNDQRRSTGDFAPWAVAGTFAAVVVDPANQLESNEFSLRLIAPEQDEGVLAAQFAASLQEMIPVFVLDAQDAPLSETVRVLVDSQSTSLYTKYARIAMAIQSLRDMRGPDPEPAAQKAATLMDVERATSFLPAGHPILDRVLFLAATEHARSGAFADAERLTKLLSPEKTAPSILKSARSLIREIAQEKRRGHEDARSHGQESPN